MSPLASRCSAVFVSVLSVALTLPQVAWAASYLPWQPEYELFCPPIMTPRRTLAAARREGPLPVAVPMMDFAPVLSSVQVPLDPTAVLLGQAPYFSGVSASEEFAPLVRIGSGTKPLEGGWLFEMPFHFVAVKSGESYTLMASWPKTATLETIAAVREAVGELLAGALDGTYEGRVE